MDEDDDSSEKKENENYINYPSAHILLIIILGLFIFSFFISIYSLKKNKNLKISSSFQEYLEIFSCGIYFSFSITNFFMQNKEINEANNSNIYLILFLCFGYITKFFCENILIPIQITNNTLKRKYSSSFFPINNKNKEDMDSNNGEFNNRNESILSNESFENSSPVDNIMGKRYSIEDNYFSIINNIGESFEKEKEKEKEPGFSCDFTNKFMNSKINNIYIYENLINNNMENKINDQLYNEKNIHSICLIILFNFHKLCQGLYVGINSFEYKYFIFNTLIIYYFIAFDSFYLGISLSKFQIKKSEINLYIFINSILYFISAIIGLIIKLLLYEIIIKIIKYFILGIFLYSCLNLLESFFYHNDNGGNKFKESKNKYYFCFFIIELILYITIFLTI